MKNVVINTGEWLWYLSEHCPIFWSCLKFVLLGHFWKFSWSVIMEYSMFRDTKISLHVCNGFLFQNTDTKGRNLVCLLWLVMFRSVLITVTQQKNLLPETSLSIATKVYWIYVERYWKDIVNFALLYCFLWLVTHVTKSTRFSLFSPNVIFQLLCVSKWGDDIL